MAGIMITTAEEIHALGWFPDPSCVFTVGEEVRAKLPEIHNDISPSTSPSLMDSAGRTLGSETRMLAASCAFALERNAGLLETWQCHDSGTQSPSGFREFETLGLAVIGSSDSRLFSDVSDSYTVFKMLEPGYAELAVTYNGVMVRRLYRA